MRVARQLGGIVLGFVVLVAGGCGKSVAELEAMLASSDREVQHQGFEGLREMGPEARAAVPAVFAYLGRDAAVFPDDLGAQWALGAIAAPDVVAGELVRAVVPRQLEVGQLGMRGGGLDRFPDATMAQALIRLTLLHERDWQEHWSRDVLMKLPPEVRVEAFRAELGAELPEALAAMGGRSVVHLRPVIGVERRDLVLVRAIADLPDEHARKLVDALEGARFAGDSAAAEEARALLLRLGERLR